MHYVLVWWFKEVITSKLKGYAGLVVYADDVVVFQELVYCELASEI